MVWSRSIFWGCFFVNVLIPIVLCEHLWLDVVELLLSTFLDVLLLVPSLIFKHHAKGCVLGEVLWAVWVSSVVRVIHVLSLAVAPAVFAMNVFIFVRILASLPRLE